MRERPSDTPEPTKQRLIRRAGDEGGFVVVLAIVVLLIGTLLAGAVITQTMSTESSVRRDSSSKRAMQAARAGIEAGTLLAISTAKTTWAASDGNYCPIKSGTTFNRTTPTGGWCPAASPQAVGTNESYTFQLSSPYTSGTTTARDVISIGTVTAGQGASGSGTTVTRRLRQTLLAAPGGAYNPFADWGIIGMSSVVTNSNLDIGTVASPVNVRSGGSITNLKSTVGICGNVTPGPGQTVNLTSASAACGGSVSPGAALAAPQPVTPPTTGTDNGQLTGNPKWNATSRVLDLGNASSLTLTGNTYVFCGLLVGSNSTLNFVPTTSGPIRVYIDSPSACASASASVRAEPIQLDSNSDVMKSGSYPLQLYVTGDTATTSSGTPSTTVTLSSNIVSIIGTIYAPNSFVEINSNVTYYGTVLAKSVQLDSNVGVYNFSGSAGDIDVGNGAGSTPPSYAPSTFVECTSSGTTSSTTGC